MSTSSLWGKRPFLGFLVTEKLDTISYRAMGGSWLLEMFICGS